MALTPTQLQSQLDALDTAINSGVLSVRYQDREEVFQTTDKLIMARDRLYGQIGRATVRQVRMSTSKGL
jgi:hypothetical protein